MEEENLILSSILDTDSYKLSHWVQYPPNTTGMYSYFESRGGLFKDIVFFGLQYYLKRYLSKKVTMEQVKEAADFAKLHGVPFNLEGWTYIATKLKGKLPVKIKAVPEGSVIPIRNILFSVESTDPKCFWVVSWVETLLVRLWYPCTIATSSYEYRLFAKEMAEKTCDNSDQDVMFKVHDFGSRGVASQEQAMIGGASHLVSFFGSDTIAGIWMANKYYNCEMAGYSIPASEHSTISMWGRKNEIDSYRNMIKQYGDGIMFACVSDTWDIFNATEKIWCDSLKQEVDQMNATLIIRPDSGDPISVIYQLIRTIDKKFGHTVNSKGYKVLNKVRLIQGDGIDYGTYKSILTSVVEMGFSSENVNFGSGGGLLQKFNRDTNEFAFKCSYARIDGKDVDVYKDPITAPNKKSKKGRLELIRNLENSIVTVPRTSETESWSLLKPVYENGEILSETTFDEVRENTRKCT